MTGMMDDYHRAIKGFGDRVGSSDVPGHVHITGLGSHQAAVGRVECHRYRSSLRTSMAGIRWR